jgi:hypothetical protein
MNIYKSQEEYIWTTPNKYSFTQEELAILNCEQTEENKEAQEALKATVVEYLQANPYAEIAAEELNALNEVYNANKPTLAETETYKLIDAAIFRKTNSEGEYEYSGLINCRVIKDENDYDNQKQIRF